MTKREVIFDQIPKAADNSAYRGERRALLDEPAVAPNPSIDD
jgi:hypothetical protein